MSSCGGDYRALCRMRDLVFRRGSRGACCLRGAKRAERTTKMKVCPVCKARVFDDMDTCYGCLHRFDSSDVEKAHGGGFEPEEPPGYSGKARNSAEAEEKKKGARPVDMRQEGKADAKPAKRDLVLHIAVPEGAAGVRVAVDFAGCAPAGQTRAVDAYSTRRWNSFSAAS